MTSPTLSTTRRVAPLFAASSIASGMAAPIRCTSSTDGTPMAATFQGESLVLSLSLSRYGSTIRCFKRELIIDMDNGVVFLDLMVETCWRGGEERI